MNLHSLPADFFLPLGPLSNVLFPAADRESHILRQAQLAGCTGLFYPGYIVFKDTDRCKPDGCCVLAARTVKTEEDQTKLLKWLGEVKDRLTGPTAGNSPLIVLDKELIVLDKELIVLDEDDPHFHSKNQIIAQITTQEIKKNKIRTLPGVQKAMELVRDKFRAYKYLCLLSHNGKEYTLYHLQDGFSTEICQGHTEKDYKVKVIPPGTSTMEEIYDSGNLVKIRPLISNMKTRFFTTALDLNGGEDILRYHIVPAPLM